MLSAASVRRLSVGIGITLPVAETWRRSGGEADWWLAIDDWTIGAALLAAAWLSRPAGERGMRALAAAWGLTLGLGLMSLAGHLRVLGARDVSGLPGPLVAAGIGAGVLLALWALVSILFAAPSGAENQEARSNSGL